MGFCSNDFDHGFTEKDMEVSGMYSVKDEIHIQVINWGKHQDYKQDRNYGKKKHWKHHFLKLSNTIYKSNSLFVLTPEEKWAWICVLCLCSQKKSGELNFYPDWFEWQTAVPVKTLFSCLKKLECNSTVTVLSQNCVRTVGVDKIRSDKNIYIGEEKTSPPSSPPAPEFDFESIYKNYPRKTGSKKKGMEKAKKQIRDNTSFENLRKAINNYAAQCEKEKKEEKFIMHFATFMGTWEDYVDQTPEKEKDQLWWARPTA
jgi:hypothetical protein